MGEITNAIFYTKVLRYAIWPSPKTNELHLSFELRATVSERERLSIESSYYQNVTGDLLKAQQILEVWSKTYPRDWTPHHRRGLICKLLGNYEKALAEIREALRLNPRSRNTYAILVNNYLQLNRFEDALGVANEARAKNLDSPVVGFDLYMIAFLKNDAAGMEREVASAAPNSLLAEWQMGNEATTAAYFGRLDKARALIRQAVASAVRAQKKEGAENYEVSWAMVEALFGDKIAARQMVSHSQLRDLEYGTALVLSLTEDLSRAQVLTDDLARRFPEDTIVQFNYLPTLHAQLAVNRNDPQSAIKALSDALPYELGNVGPIPVFPIYVRGAAYLSARNGPAAATEFQKIIDHRGIVLNSPIGALAHLQLGRAYAMQGDTVKAKTAYQDFLTLWKDADSDIPVLKQAKAEYAKLM